MSNELFNNDGGNDPAPQHELSYMGEGKKYGTVEELDSAYAHANDHIGKIEEENAKLREQMEALTKQGNAVEEVLKALKGKSVQDDPADDPVSQHQPVEQPDLTDVVRQALDAERARTTQESNVAKVQEELTKLYGDKAAEQYAAKGKALGIDLDVLSAQSADAVLELFKVASAPAPAPIGGSYNSEALVPGAEVGTHAYIEKQYAEGKMSREEKFRQQHAALSANPEHYWSKK